MSRIWCIVRTIHLHQAQAGCLCHQGLHMSGLTIRADELIMVFEGFEQRCDTSLTVRPAKC